MIVLIEIFNFIVFTMLDLTSVSLPLPYVEMVS